MSNDKVRTFICEACNGKYSSLTERKDCGSCEDGVRYEKYISICKKCDGHYIYTKKKDGYYYNYTSNRKSNFAEMLKLLQLDHTSKLHMDLTI